MSKELRVRDKEGSETEIENEAFFSEYSGEARSIEVREQAGSEIMAPIRKRSALPRTPPQRRSHSLPEDGGRNFVMREEQDKRKREDDSPKEGEANSKVAKKPRETKSAQRNTVILDDAVKVKALDRVKDLINKVDEEVASLYNVTSNSRNTRVEIKDHAEKLVILMGELTNLDIGSVMEGMKMEKPETREVGVQAELRGRLRSRKEVESTEIVSLEGCDTLARWREIYKRRWHPDVYKCTEITEGAEIMETKGSIAKVVFVTTRGEKSTCRKVWEMFPELTTTEEDFVVLEQTTKIRASSNTGGTRKIIRLIIDGSDEDLWEKLCTVRDEVEGDDRVKVRKMLECIFQHTTTKTCLYTAARERSVGKAQKKTIKGSKERDTCALVVEGTQKENYTDVLKRVKEGVKESTASSKIRGLRSTRDGRILIIMDKDEIAASRVQEIVSEIPGRLKIVKAGQSKQDTTIHVRGMDALTTRQDVIEAVERRIGPLTGKICRLRELRPNLGNTLAATLVLDREDASKIVEAGPLRIGYVTCKVEKRVNMTRCFKCWSYTHRIKDCVSETDRSRACYRCGKDGHSIKECANGEACPMCGDEGHMAGTRKCRFFRNALALAKDTERGKDSVSNLAIDIAEQEIVSAGEKVELESHQGTSND